MTHQEIAEEAYRIYLWRTIFNPPFPGDDITDWHEAEENLKERQAAVICKISEQDRIGKYL